MTQLRIAFTWTAGVALALVLMLQAGTAAFPQQRRGGGQRGSDGTRSAAFKTAVPDHPVDVILARPTADSISLSILFYRDARAAVFCGPCGGVLSNCAPPADYKAGEPALAVLSGLKPDTLYAYEVRASGGAGGAASTALAGTFRTQRAPGRAFTFTVTADSHLDERSDPSTYARTLNAAAADEPDFHVDLGDTFMTDQHPDRSSAAQQYLAQRYYFGLIARGAPLFLALGNHDGEGTRRGRGGDDSAAWALGMRTRYFPNPVPDGFYSGNASRGPAGNPLEDYYAWRWGDALFIVLDPFWYSTRSGGDNGWNWTLGEDQYRWLERTLARREARFTFVFIHHLVGGADRQARGGAEAARYYEWGGASADGTPGFAARRPGWALPVHDLLVAHGATAVLHGHDHLYAQQERDGLIYQEVPQPGDGRSRPPQSATEYGYRSGTVLGGTGYLRVRVSPDAAVVDFIDTRPAMPARSVHQYEIKPAAAAGPKR